MEQVKHWYGRSSWTPTDRFFAFLTFLAVVWVCMPTSRFIQPISLAVSYNNVVHPQFEFKREVPFGPVWAKTTVDVYGPHDDCQQVVDRVRYQKVDSPNEVVYYKLDAGGDKCIVPGEKFIITTKREAIISGPFRWPGSTTSWECPKRSGKCEPVQR